MSQVVVLGAGMVGRAIAWDLSDRYEVISVDYNPENLKRVRGQRPVQTREVDFGKRDTIKAAISEADLVVGAVPGFMGFETLKTVIEAGKTVVDISFFPENALELDALAKEKGVTAIVDCGVAPGLSHLLAGRWNSEWILESYECLVGGLPISREWPFEYKAPFSPIDVIEEYTRPARLQRDCRVETVAPLTDREMINFEAIGTLEAFNTDGLRSLLHTMTNVPQMQERTLRYPGHIDLILKLKASGFFSRELITINGQTFAPLDYTSEILTKNWKLGDEEPEFTVMRVIMEGTDSNQKVQTITYDLFDQYDHETKFSSMARTTGFTCTAACSMVLEGLWTDTGIIPPEYLGREEKHFHYMLNYLEARDIRLDVSVAPVVS